jgi:TonB family protein
MTAFQPVVDSRLTGKPIDLLFGLDRKGNVMRLPGLFASIGFVVEVILSTVASSAASEAPLQPIRPWVLDYADAQCAAGRDYGDDERPVTLIIRPAVTGDAYELQLIRKTIGPAFAEEDSGSVDFGSGPVTGSVLHFGNVADKLDIYQFRITTAQMQQARPALQVTLRNAHGPDASFSLTSMPALLTGLDQCNNNLRRYWNVDKKTVEIAEPARGDVRRVFNDDYPDDAVREGKEGTAQFLLLIDTSGKVAACNVLKPSGVPLLDVMGCQVIRERAKFKAARDAAGKPMRDSIITPPVVWRLAL